MPCVLLAVGYVQLKNLLVPSTANSMLAQLCGDNLGELSGGLENFKEVSLWRSYSAEGETQNIAAFCKYLEKQEALLFISLSCVV